MGAGFGWSIRFKLEPLVEKLHQLAQCRPAKSKGALDNAGLAADVAGDVEGRRLSFSERGVLVDHTTVEGLRNWTSPKNR